LHAGGYKNRELTQTHTHTRAVRGKIAGEKRGKAGAKSERRMANGEECFVAETFRCAYLGGT